MTRRHVAVAVLAAVLLLSPRTLDADEHFDVSRRRQRLRSTGLLLPTFGCAGEPSDETTRAASTWNDTGACARVKCGSCAWVGFGDRATVPRVLVPVEVMHAMRGGGGLSEFGWPHRKPLGEGAFGVRLVSQEVPCNDIASIKGLLFSCSPMAAGMAWQVEADGAARTLHVDPIGVEVVHP